MSAPNDSVAKNLTRVGAMWFTLFTVAWLLIWTVQLTPLQLLLPLQLDTGSGGGENGWIRGVVFSGLILGVGGLAGVLAGPAAGALSDRVSKGRAKRRPFALAGVWITATCLMLTGFSAGPLLIGASWVGVSIGIAVASAALTAMIADQLPVSQRGSASSAVGSSQAVGIVLGVGAVVLLGLSVVQGYVALAVLMAVVGTAVVFLMPDPSGTSVAADTGVINIAHMLEGKRMLQSLKDRDFKWMLVGRLVTNIGNALGTTLFLFFLMYGIGQPMGEAEDNLLLLIVVYTFFVVIASVSLGIISDKIGKRRLLTIVSALIQAISGVVIVVSPTFEATMVAAAFMGVGYGAFSTVGLAFATDLLPSERNHARDLGIVNVTAGLGQLLGPMLGAALVWVAGGFWLVFTCAALLSVLGAWLTGLARENAR